MKRQALHALDELKAAYDKYRADPEFQAEFQHELAHFVGRPSPVYHAARLSREIGGAQIHLKREDLNHTGAHKVNNTIGQALLARRMGFFPTTHAVFAMLNDKDIAGVIAKLGARIDHWYVGSIGGPRGTPADALAAVLRDVAAAHGYTYSISAHESVGAAYAAARECAAPDDRILAFGSFLTVADVMRVLRVRASPR